MKKKELTELRDKTLDEISKKAQEIKKQISKLETEKKESKEKNVKKIKNLKHDLSQTLTIQREKEIIGKEKEDKEQ
jgi:ribosomal protein L29